MVTKIIKLTDLNQTKTWLESKPTRNVSLVLKKSICIQISFL